MLQSYEHMCKKCAPWGMTVLRAVVGIILIFHGYPKLFGDTTQMLAFFESTVLPFPAFMLGLAGILELVGGALLILGLFTRFTATILLLEFLVILLFVKFNAGFARMELDLLLFGALFALSSIGAGRPCLDDIIHKRKNGKEAVHGHGPEAIGG